MSDETLTGILDKIHYHQDGFLIGRLRGGPSIKGSMLAPRIGIEYAFAGKTERHPKFGDQFNFKSYTVLVPRSAEALMAYLDANAMWVGPAIAKKIFDAYGMQSIDTLKYDPEGVAQRIPGLTLERAQKISVDLIENESTEQLELSLRDSLSGVDISRTVFQRIVKEYGSDAATVVATEPYRLASEIDGVSFVIADKIARKHGIEDDAPQRLVAGVVHVLKEAAFSGGHVYLPRTEAIGEAKKLLRQPRGAIEQALHEYVGPSHGNGYIEFNDKEVGLYALRYAEKRIASKIIALLRASLEETAITPDLSGLAQDQIEAVQTALNSGVFVLSGAAGTGKTTAIKKIIEGFMSTDVALCAPTGKAARRIEELCGHRASTIHVLLGAKPYGKGFAFDKNSSSQLPYRLIVCDEASMISVELMAALLEAVAEGTRLILIGDPYQLPSVGPGSVLGDLIESGIVPALELKTIKRQNPGMIVENCRKIRDGFDIEIEPENVLPEQRDFTFIHAHSVSDVQSEILMMLAAYSKTVQDPLTDIQVITALREKSDLSVKGLNDVIRSYHHLTRQSGYRGNDFNRPFLKGDKVIQRKNDYKLGVMNGDIGVITEANPKDGEIIVEFKDPRRTVVFPLDNKLELAYAITTHSAQGSEWPVVIVVCHSVLGQMIPTRPWIYTSLTRAKKMCILVGQRDEITKVIRRNQSTNRWTKLKTYLKEFDEINEIDEFDHAQQEIEWDGSVAHFEDF